MQSEWTEPKFWHCAHSFEPSSCANHTLILIASLSSYSKQINSASSNCHTHTVSASKKMCFLGKHLVQFTVHCLPQVSVTLISMCYYLKQMSCTHQGDLCGVINQMAINFQPFAICLRLTALSLSLMETGHTTCATSLKPNVFGHCKHFKECSYFWLVVLLLY